MKMFGFQQQKVSLQFLNPQSCFNCHNITTWRMATTKKIVKELLYPSGAMYHDEIVEKSRMLL